MARPMCARCGGVMAPADSRVHPEFFPHDSCLPAEIVGKARRFLVQSGGLNEVVEAADHDAAVEAAIRVWIEGDSDTPLGVLAMVVEVVDDDPFYVSTGVILGRLGNPL